MQMQTSKYNEDKAQYYIQHLIHNLQLPLILFYLIIHTLVSTG